MRPIQRENKTNRCRKSAAINIITISQWALNAILRYQACNQFTRNRSFNKVSITLILQRTELRHTEVK